MQRITLYLFASGIAACLVSLVYFLSLQITALPFVVTALFSICSLLVFFWFIKKQAIQFRNDELGMILPIMVVLFIFLSTFTSNSIALAERYGEWDAWAIWNLQAKYLSDPLHWKKMLLNVKNGHPDYPLFVPSVIAFFNRLLGNVRIEVISFAFSFWIAILIPAVLFIQTLRKSLILAILLLWYFASDTFYITRGVSMYADTTLAFFFLAALISVRQQEHKLLWHWVAGACIGCCLWTKNEGMVLSLLFLVFYFKQFHQQRLLRPIVFGAALPVIILVFFKFVYAPANDMVGGQNLQTFQQLFDFNRYKLIYSYFTDNFIHKFGTLRVVVLIYLGYHLLLRKIPNKQFLLVITCLVAYFMVYVLSVQDLEWHLSTSADRLLHQLMPAMVYALLSLYPDPKPVIQTKQQWTMPD